MIKAGTTFVYDGKLTEVLNYLPNLDLWTCRYYDGSNLVFLFTKEIEERMKKDMNFEYKFYEKNLAPKWLEGDYDLHIEGNKMTMTSKQGTKVETRCHPDDDWRLQIGLDELKDRMTEAKKPKIEKGCIVKPMDRYRYYTPDDVCDFFHDSNIPMEDIMNAVRAQLQNCRPSVAFRYYVKKTGWHTDEKTREKREVALIKSMETLYEYVVDIDSLELVE